MPKVAQQDLDQFGLAVKRARVGKGWTLDQLAGSLTPPSGKSFLSNVEKGQRPISALTVSKLVTALDLPASWIDRFLNSDVAAGSEETPQDLNAERLISMNTPQPSGFRPAEALLIALAYQYAPGSEGDLVSASNGLRAALDTAAEMQRTARLPHNAADQVDAVLTELEALNAKGELDAGAATLITARAAARDRIAEETSGLMRLLDSTVAQARLRNAPQDAADALVEKLLLDNPSDPFESLRALRREWYERGRDQGLAFDATIAIHIAEYSLTRTQTAVQRITALNDLAIGLSVLGRHDRGVGRLEAAVAAFESALQILKCDRAPLQWATLQMNLGIALANLGDREPGTKRLKAAVKAFIAALQELSQDRVPLEWATAQMNLGSALIIIGERECSALRFEDAVTAFEAALEEFRRDREPLDWAMAQMNLGNALLSLGKRESGSTRLIRAVAAYTEALKEQTRDRVPLDWAMTQMNLGAALRNLGEREPGTARLVAAVVAQTEALREYTVDRAPLQWAMVQFNLAGIEIAYFNKTANLSHLATARTHMLVAREVFVEAQAEHYVQMADIQLANIAARTP